MSNLGILSNYRRRLFDSIPKLASDERLVYISLDKDSKLYLSNKNSHRKVGFLLHRAYFQAKGRFFSLDDAYKRDINFALSRLGLPSSFKFDPSKYSQTLQNEDKKRILNLFSWQPYGPQYFNDLIQHAKHLVSRRLSSERILFALLDYCWAKRITIPSYSTLSGIVTNAFREFESNVLECWKSNSTAHLRSQLLNFIRSGDNSETYKSLRKIDQDDSLRAMQKNASLLEITRDYFFSVEKSLIALNLTPEGIQHFSEQVSKNDLAQLRRQKDEVKLSLHLASFIQDQFYQRQDAMLDAFKKIIRNAINTAKKTDLAIRAQKEEESLNANKTMVDSAKQSRAVLRQILSITKDEDKTFFERNEQVMHLVEAFFNAETDDIDDTYERFDINITQLKKRQGFYHYLFKQHYSLIKKLSPALKALTFDPENSDTCLIQAIAWFCNSDSSFNDDTPLEFLRQSEIELITEQSEIPTISRWKILLFSHVIEGMKNKKLTLKYSYRYRLDETYLIPHELWVSNRDTFIKEANLEHFINGSDVIQKIGERLNEQYKQVNDLIDQNEIIGFRKIADRWSLKELEPDFDESKFIPNLLSEKKAVTLYELLAEVDKYSEYSKSLQHNIDGKELDSKHLKHVYAALMSLGTNLGHHNMARAARNITEKQLRDIEKMWLSPESISKANDSLVEIIQSLPLPTIFHNKQGELHTSSDGKKIVVAVNSLLANFSYKYFGKEAGVSANSFTDEHQAFFHVNVLTSSDREAAYMLDGMVEATKTLYPEGERAHLHSTDTHGVTEAAFAGLHFIHVSLAPRYKQLPKQTIYSFDTKTRDAMKGRSISPRSVINRTKILKQWDKMLHLMASIKLGYCSASHMFRLLSVSEKSSELYGAMQEFGRLIKSSFILSYIEQPDLRRNIQKQLNRIELGQKLSEAVFFGRSGRLMVGTPTEIQKAMAAKTLLKNAIIVWNYLYLSDFCCQLKDENQKQDVINSIATGSVIAWSHINMHGVYDFDRAPGRSFKSSMTQMRALKVT